MRSLSLLPVLLLAVAGQASAQADLEDGLAGALRGCEAWILEPQSWIDGPAPFLGAIGLGGKVSAVTRVPEEARAPPSFRRGEKFWRIAANRTTDYVLVVSDQIALCHISGWGKADMQPATEAVLTSPAFAARWEETAREKLDGMTTTHLRSRIDAKLTLAVSRAEGAGERLDRIQVIATAVYDTDP